MATTEAEPTNAEILKTRVKAVRPNLPANWKDRLMEEFPEKGETKIMKTYYLKRTDIKLTEAMEALAAENENAKNQKK